MRRSFPSLSVRTRLTLWYSGILLAIVVTIGALSYSWLRVGLLQDLDASLLTVAQVVKDTGSAAREAGDHEMRLRELLGPELYDKFFQLLDPEGRPRTSPPARRPYTLALSAAARARAARGQNTFETVLLADSEPVRVLTTPIVREGRVVEIVQVGMLLRRARATLDRYLDTLTVLIPIGVALAAVGGALIAQVALRPLDRMTRTARRISAEDLSQRVERPRTGDELDRLAETMNDMLAHLERAIARPSPAPPVSRLRAASRRTKGSKIRSASGGSTPMPVSATATSADPPAAVRLSSTLPPRGVYLTAFSTRFTKARRKAVTSPRAVAGVAPSMRTVTPAA